MIEHFASQIQNFLTPEEKIYYERAFQLVKKQDENRTSLPLFDKCIQKPSGVKAKDKLENANFFDTYGKKKMSREDLFVFMRAGALFLAGKELSEKTILSKDFDNRLMLKVLFDDNKKGSIMDPGALERTDNHSTSPVVLNISPLKDSDLNQHLETLKTVNSRSLGSISFRSYRPIRSEPPPKRLWY
jgi:hypothetical protein